jgi:PAS domain S-box-containing protein
MNKRPFSFLAAAIHWGAMEIAGIYLLLGGAWILFSDEVASRIAVSEEMLATISLYKGWGFIVVTALLLYWMIRRLTSALQESEQQLHRVIDAVPAFISYVSADLRYRFTNKSYEEWFDEHADGKHVEEVLGKGAYEIISKHIDRALKGETISYETEVPVRDQERFFHITYVPDVQTDGRVKGFFVLALDRTEQKQAEEERRLWADAFEGCAHGIAIGDPNTNRIVVCNPAFARMHKSRVEDIVGSAILSLYALSDHEHVRQNIQKADQIGHASFEAKMTRRSRDHAAFPVQMDVVSVLGENGELLHRVATAQDISERKAVDEKLKESETKYRTLVEHLPVITYISGPDQYMGVSYISPQIEALGFDAEAWLADPELWFRHIHPDDQEQVAKELQRFQDGAESFRTEYRLILPTGEIRWFHDDSVRVKDEHGKTILKQGFMLDITDRKHAEKILQESEERYRMVSELTSDYAYKDRVQADGSIIPEWFTEAFPRITGYTLEETKTHGFWQRLVHPEDTPILLKHVQVVLSGQPDTMELRVITKSGQVRWLRDYSNPVWDAEKKRVVELYGAVQDITEYKQAEQLLLLQARWLEQINDAVIVSDRDRVITAWNRAAEEIFGWKADEVIGKKGEDVLKTQFFSISRAEAIQQLQEKGEFSAEITQLRRDGSSVYIETRSVALRDESGHITGYVSVNRDISERKGSEAALKASQEQLLSLIKQAPISIAMFDREMRYMVNSQRWVIDYGRGYTDLMGRSHYEIHPDLPEMWKEMHRRGLAGETLKSDNDLWIQADGTENWLRWAIVPWHDDHGEIGGIIISAENITEGKRAEEALRLKDELLRLTSEMAKVGGWEFDAETGKGAWTDEVARIHDLDPAEDTSVEIGLNFYVDESRKKVEQAIQEAIQLAKPYDLELEMVTAKGNHKWVRTMALPIVLNGKVVRVQGIFQDITERKQIEQELQEAQAELELKVQERTAALSEANALLQALMDNIPDHIYFKDTQCRFIRNSRSQATSLGLQDPSEAVGKTDFEFFPHAAQSYADEQEVMRSGEPHVDFEERVVWPDGRETWVTTTKMPLRTVEGQTIGIFGISHDITERKRAEQAIRQLNTDLEKQAEQLQAANKELEAFSYSVSHDLRAPLRAIDGYTRILLEDYEPFLDDEGKRICGVISREARRMGQLIDDLLSFSRLGRKEMYSSKIDMNSLAASVFEELAKEENRERIDFELGKLPMAKGDSSLIRQVWVNLLSNAIKFTSKKERSIIEVGSKYTREEQIYYVRDNGAGFDMEYGNKLFGVFQRLHSEGEFSGTGVGLAIVQRIVRRHGGRVWAQGEVEQGATFYFALPRKENLS